MLDHLTSDLPDPESARRFLGTLEELHPRYASRLRKNDGLLSDVLTLASYSPLLGTTLEQNPDYLTWLDRKRRSPTVRSKEELLEALGRFVLTHSTIDLHTHLARFRRRELLRIFLSDIRRLATIAEITEDISSLADAILETALRSARQEMDNRFGSPEVIDTKGRKTTAGFCIVSLGKLGSRELNYSSDIDLMFLYSDDGETSGRGTRGSVTNREYFIKLGEAVTQLVGKQAGEGAAYRVDMRLRPHGRVGPLAISVRDAIRYYTSEAHDWERQVLIRSRASAGDADIYKSFFDAVENVVFAGTDREEKDYDPQPAIRRALDSVSRSKQRIDLELRSDRGFNVKLGRGGIREIEFIAQALQLAYGGDDRWLRASHTLISLTRLADRHLISESELTELFSAYEFLRHLEHVLQMEHGLQTHTVPNEVTHRELIARKMRCGSLVEFDDELFTHTKNVHRVFERVFAGEDASLLTKTGSVITGVSLDNPLEPERHGAAEPPANDVSLSQEQSAHRAAGVEIDEDYRAVLAAAVARETDFRHRLAALRQSWTALIGQIRTADTNRSVDVRTSKSLQTALAEASIETALDITSQQLDAKFGAVGSKMAVMGLGKLGGGAIDYESDLDLVLVHPTAAVLPHGVTPEEFYSEAAKVFVTTLSSITRDGYLYRVDLRLRPYGKNGTSTISAGVFKEYMRESAAIWEWLAYVKIRGVAGDLDLARSIEYDLREIIHKRAIEADPDELASETRRMRMLLEKERARTRRAKEVDIKYGPGGMLDVYFAIRYLQLRDNIPDTAENRSTEQMLSALRERGSLLAGESETLLDGYRFLSLLDHELRLAVGRTTRLPLANTKALDAVAQRMNLIATSDLTEQLALHRINIRSAFNNVMGAKHESE